MCLCWTVPLYSLAQTSGFLPSVSCGWELPLDCRKSPALEWFPEHSMGCVCSAHSEGCLLFVPRQLIFTVPLFGHGGAEETEEVWKLDLHGCPSDIITSSGPVLALFSLSQFLRVLQRLGFENFAYHIYLISLHFCHGFVLCFPLGQSYFVHEFCVYFCYNSSPFNLPEHEFTFMPWGWGKVWPEQFPWHWSCV